jgi:hypothetical protein
LALQIVVFEGSAPTVLSCERIADGVIGRGCRSRNQCLAGVDDNSECGDDWRASGYEHFGNLFEFGHSPSIQSDRDRYPMMDEIIRKVLCRLKTRLGKCEAVGNLALITCPPSLPVMERGRIGDPAFSNGGDREC